MSKRSEAKENEPSDVVQEWEKSLSSIPSLFAQLIFLSQMKDETGRYKDPFLLGKLSGAGCDTVLRDVHYRVLMRWISLSMAEKLFDLKPYLGWLGREDPKSLLGISLERIAEHLIPRDLTLVEMRMFLSVVQSVVDVLVNRE